MFTRILRVAGVLAASAACLAPGALAMAQGMALNTADYAPLPRSLARAALRPADPAQQAEAIVWLKLHDQAALEQAVAQMYDPTSPRYRQWMSSQELAAFKPDAAELEIVRQELKSYGLSTVVDSDGLFVRAHGSVAQLQAAFHTNIATFRRGSQVFNANVTAPALNGRAGELMFAVSGLDQEVHQHPMFKLQGNFSAQEPGTKRFAAAAPPSLSSFITSDCFQPPATFQLGTAGVLPYATYAGNVYNPGQLQCGFTVAQVQAAYGLPDAYAQGLRGDGQTIVIIDAFGSPTILQDANTFSAASGLPALSDASFKIVYPDGQPRITNFGWALETTLDVEWAHAMAPNAHIVLVVPQGEGDQEFQLALNYAITHRLGGVISNSYGAPEYDYGHVTETAYERQFLLAAASGIAVNYASGDSGDFGLGTPVGAAGYPSSSPNVTSVGGTSLGIPVANGGTVELGWGGNVIQLGFFPTQGLVQDPPLLQNSLGSGGGESLQFAKPAWQKALPGKGRQTPDIAAVADPLTGVPIIMTTGAGVQVGVVGGTSAACPIFSGIWTVANQSAHAWLGQAAPAIARMPASALNDIVPVSSASNASGTIVDQQGSHFYSAAALAAPLFNTSAFFDVLHQSGPFLTLYTLGTDTSLTVTPGWDNVTGFGTPRGLAFITAAASGQ
jgi:subtilase family serine protease